MQLSSTFLTLAIALGTTIAVEAAPVQVGGSSKPGLLSLDSAKPDSNDRSLFTSSVNSADDKTVNVGATLCHDSLLGLIDCDKSTKAKSDGKPKPTPKAKPSQTKPQAKPPTQKKPQAKPQTKPQTKPHSQSQPKQKPTAKHQVHAKTTVKPHQSTQQTPTVHADGGSAQGGNGGIASGGSSNCSTGNSLVGLSALNLNSCNGGNGGSASGGAAAGGQGGESILPRAEDDSIGRSHEKQVEDGATDGHGDVAKDGDHDMDKASHQGSASASKAKQTEKGTKIKRDDAAGYPLRHLPLSSLYPRYVEGEDVKPMHQIHQTKEMNNSAHELDEREMKGEDYKPLYQLHPMKHYDHSPKNFEKSESKEEEAHRRSLLRGSLGQGKESVLRHAIWKGTAAQKYKGFEGKLPDRLMPAGHAKRENDDYTPDQEDAHHEVKSGEDDAESEGYMASHKRETEDVDASPLLFGYGRNHAPHSADKLDKRETEGFRLRPFAFARPAKEARSFRPRPGQDGLHYAKVAPVPNLQKTGYGQYNAPESVRRQEEADGNFEGEEEEADADY